MDPQSTQLQKKQSQSKILQQLSQKYPPLITYSFNDDIIHIKIISDDPELQVCSWQATIQSINSCSQVLTNFFESMEQFYQYLQDRSNIRIDCCNGTIAILLKTTIKNKENISEIAKIRMKPTSQLDLRTVNLQKIVQFCKSDEHISNKTIKSFLKHLSQTLLNPPNPIDTHLQPILLKLQTLGCHSQTLQHKFSTLYTQLSQHRQQTNKQILQTNNQIIKNYNELKDYIQTIKEGIDRQIMKNQNKYESFMFQVREMKEKNVREIVGLKELVREVEGEIGRVRGRVVNKFGEIEKDKMKIDLTQLVDTEQPFFKYFTQTKSTITKTRQTNSFTMLVFKHPLNKHPRLTLRIENLTNSTMNIGMIDIKHRNQEYCEQKDNRFWCNNQGIISNGIQERIQKNMKWGKKDVVIMEYLAELGIVRWAVGDREVVVPLQGSAKAVWLPCVWVGCVGDSVTVISQE